MKFEKRRILKRSKGNIYNPLNKFNIFYTFGLILFLFYNVWELNLHKKEVEDDIHIVDSVYDITHFLESLNVAQNFIFRKIRFLEKGQFDQIDQTKLVKTWIQKVKDDEERLFKVRIANFIFLICFRISHNMLKSLQSISKPMLKFFS